MYVPVLSQVPPTVVGYFVATPDASSITLASVMSVGKESRFPRRARERGLEGIRQSSTSKWRQ